MGYTDDGILKGKTDADIAAVNELLQASALENRECVIIDKGNITDHMDVKVEKLTGGTIGNKDSMTKPPQNQHQLHQQVRFEGKRDIKGVLSIKYISWKNQHDQILYTSTPMC